jgi:hypothetical protein
MIVLFIVFFFIYVFIEHGIEIKFNEDGTEDRFNKNLCWGMLIFCPIISGILYQIKQSLKFL